MGRHAYPVSDAGQWETIGSLSAWQRLMLHLRTGRQRRRAPATDGIELTSERAVRPLAPDDLPLVCTVRNAAAFLPAFLEHYRRLGVTRFIVVDDRSDDGTAELLGAQADVDLYRSNVTYAQAMYGRIWRDQLYTLNGRGRWYVNVDADEFLLFPGCETRSLHDFIADLTRAGRLRALAPMLDLYPDGPLGNAVFDPARHASPMDVSGLIDGDGYEIGPEKIGLAVRGGPRTRLFGNEIRLSKFPVLFVDGETQENGASIHAPLPLGRNFTPVAGVLLHFKFSAASVAEFARLVAEGQHFGGGVFYRQIAEDPSFNDGLTLRYSGSLPVPGSAELVARGFMQDLREESV